MKRIVQLLLMSMIGVLIGCGPTYIGYQDEIIISIPQEWVEHMPYEANVIPKFVYQFEGIRNVASYSKEHMIILTKNDDFKVSDDVERMLDQFVQNSLVTKRNEQAAEQNVARLGGQEFVIAEPSYEYWHILFLEDGTRVSMEYRMFTSGGKTYYGWTYASGITIRMELPIMVREETINNQTKKVFYLLALPNEVKYELSNNISTKRLLSNQDYVTNQSWYTFSYPEHIEVASTKEEKIEYVKEWYDTYCFGRIEDNQYVITYLGYDFRVNFDATKYHKSLNETLDAFELIFIGKSS
ncbi:MAG TPA: hypothetical protein PLR26_01100 [Bacilli bacterium]|nr:hypothetical protein [Bacilli bacterium]